MQSERLIVKWVSANNCFVYVPDRLLRSLEAKDHVIEIAHKNFIYFASCNAKPNIEGKLYIGTAFARALNVEEGDEVFVSSVKDAPNLSSIEVTPHDESDREILELQADKVQSTLLNQIRVVARNQPIVVWVSKFSSITLTTDSLEPNFMYGRLEQFTEVHVKHVALSRKRKENEHTNNSFSVINNLSTRIKNLLFTDDLTDEQNQNQSKHKELLQSFRRKQKTLIYRVSYLPKRKFNNKLNVQNDVTHYPYNVFVPTSHLPENVDFSSGFARFVMKKVTRDYVANAASTNFLRPDDPSIIKLTTELVVKLFPLEKFLANFHSASDENYFALDSVHNSVYISESVGISLNLERGSKVILSSIDVDKQPVPSSIELFSSNETMTVDQFRDQFKKYFTANKCLINSCASFVFDNGDSYLIRLLPRICKFVEIDEKSFNNTTIHLKDSPNNPDVKSLKDLNKDVVPLRKIAIRHLNKILADCKLILDFSLGFNKKSTMKYDRENILIHGGIGSGKTTICKILSHRLQSAPYFVYTQTIDCRSLKGKKVEVLQKQLGTVMSDCVYYQPSVLFLDDLESVTNASASDEENTPDAVNAARITDMLVNIVTQYQESHYVSIIGTCASVNKIGQKLRPARGAHFFRNVLSIPNLEKVDRIDILQLMLGDKLYVPGDVNWDYYGNKTEGWMVQDLVDMAEKATFTAWKRHGTESEVPVVIEEEDIVEAMNSTTPMSLEGIELFKSSGHRWSDIGGLTNVKKSLTEILQWPLKYPEIFKNAPIKLQNGVLLYGMPGTGKTMLAKAIATECGVNLISIKGPELLSKYIGVSEESVRNIFERARRAKPCVLFFDEFDSLAPRRGHDSTGVTDRVVNQLLTQLDGVEEREGVAVVAASSRPDLLDPALLRPGRLDKALYCPIPTEVEREDILLVLCQSQSIETCDLNLKELADISTGFTGADLNAAVTQARLSAYEEAVTRVSDGRVEATDIEVRQDHLVAAISSTHPSLSKSEKMKYEKIYARFGKGDSFAGDILKNQKATLA